MKSLIAFAAGFGAGWAVRSISDSPHGVGVKIVEVVYRAKGQFSRWSAVERERIADILAEARSRAEQSGLINRTKADSQSESPSDSNAENQSENEKVA
jgi:hypothetical protein